MAGRFNWRDVAGTAKKWIDEKVTETVTSDRQEERAADARQRDLEQTLRDEVPVTALATAFPSLRRAIDRQDDARRRAEDDALADERSRRAARVLDGSSIEVAGAVSGRVDGVAVQLLPEDGALVVLLEPVDAAPLSAGAVAAAGFALAHFGGPGRYDLTDDDESVAPGANHVLLAGDDESATFYWSEGYGPGTVVVADDLIVATLACRNSSDDEIRVTMRVPLG